MSNSSIATTHEVVPVVTVELPPLHITKQVKPRQPPPHRPPGQELAHPIEEPQHSFGTNRMQELSPRLNPQRRQILREILEMRF